MQRRNFLKRMLGGTAALVAGHRMGHSPAQSPIEPSAPQFVMPDGTRNDEPWPHEVNGGTGSNVSYQIQITTSMRP